MPRTPFLLPLCLSLAACGFGGGSAPRPEIALVEENCARLAAGQLSVPVHDVLVLPIDRVSGGYTAAGQAVLAGGAVATFRCDLNDAGQPTGFRRTG